MDGKIHSIETFGLVDGPGVRYVLFLQGCNMRCKYCHNPETWSFDDAKFTVSAKDAFSKAYKYKNYWRKNGKPNGGITVSGGEPLLQIDFVTEFFKLAKEKGVIIGEAMTIYHMPIYKELKKILGSCRLGRVNLITMNFGSFKEDNMKNRFFNRNLAGGAMRDIGVYALSFLRWFFDSKPDQLLSQVKPAPTGVDEQAGLLLTNQEGQMASVMLSLHSKQPKRGMVSCENGFIEIMEYPRAWEAKITDASTGESEIIKAGDNADALAYELADMERAINGDASAMHLDYTKDVMDLMTSFRRTWGYTYPEEEK